MSAGTYSSPRNSLLLRERSVKLTSLPSSLGNSPAKSENVSKHTTHVCWDIRLALKLVVARIEERQIDKVAKLLGQFSCQKATMSAKHTTNVCWDIQILPSSRMLLRMSFLSLVKTATSAVMVPPNWLLPRLSSSSFVSVESSLIVS